MLPQRPMTIMNFLNIFKNLNITTTKQDIDEFVTIDDNSSHVYQEYIVEEAKLASST